MSQPPNRRSSWTRLSLAVLIAALILLALIAVGDMLFSGTSEPGGLRLGPPPAALYLPYAQR